MYFFLQGMVGQNQNLPTKNKMESKNYLSTIDTYLSLKVKRSLPLVSSSSCSNSNFTAIRRLETRIIKFSTKVSENKLNINEEFLF